MFISEVLLFSLLYVVFFSYPCLLPCCFPFSIEAQYDTSFVIVDYGGGRIAKNSVD